LGIIKAQELDRFLADVLANELRPYIRFAPTCVRLELEEDRFSEAGVNIYDPSVSLAENLRFTGLGAGARGNA
jgi:hypothetical protein